MRWGTCSVLETDEKRIKMLSGKNWKTKPVGKYSVRWDARPTSETDINLLKRSGNFMYRQV
jgi:hypothetical protein